MDDKYRVVILMGSRVDIDWVNRIAGALEGFGIKSIKRLASAHKVPFKCMDIIKEYEGGRTIFITVAGRSNALSGFVDAQTACPVIACPPASDRFAGGDILSTLRMPSGVAPMTVIEPENAALAAAKIIGAWDGDVMRKVKKFQEGIKKLIDKEDEEMKNGQC